MKEFHMKLTVKKSSYTAAAPGCPRSSQPICGVNYRT
jgi:hypothetical protein